MSVPHHKSGSVNTPSSFTSTTSSKFNSRYSPTSSMMRNAYMDPSSMPMTASSFAARNYDEDGDIYSGCHRTEASMYDLASKRAARTAASMYDMDSMRSAMTAASMYSPTRTAASMYDDSSPARTAAAMYDDAVMRATRTAASMYDDSSPARTAAAMYDDAVMRAAMTGASMHDDAEMRSFSNPYSRSTTSKSFNPSLACSVTKSSFPKPLFPKATTASAFGEYWE